MISRKFPSRNCAFYDTFYWPNNATVSIIGDFDPSAALEFIKQNYGKISRSPNPIPEVYTEEPPQTGPRRVTVKRPGELGVVMIAQKIPPATHSDYAPLQVFGTLLTDGRNSRLYQALIDKSFATDVEAVPTFHRDPSLFIVTVQLTPDAAHAEVEKRLLKEITRIQNEGVKPAEVAAAIAKLCANTAFDRDGSMAMAAALNENIAVGDWTLYYHLDDLVRKVTPADVQRVAKQYFSENQRVTGWYIPATDRSTKADPADSNRAADPTATANSKGSEAEPVTSKKDAPTLHSSAAALNPEPVKTSNADIVPRIVRTRTAGIDLLVCPTAVKDVITIRGTFPAFDPSNPMLGQLAAEMLERGTKKHRRKPSPACSTKSELKFNSASNPETSNSRRSV